MEKFLVDIMLGKLAKWLRLLGYDTIYTSISNSRELQDFLEKGYVFLTRRRAWQHYRILRNKPIYLVQNNEVLEQLCEVIKEFHLQFSPELFCSRCLLCNTLLVEKDKTEIASYVSDYVLHNFNHFKQCPKCKRIYWSGSHKKRMQERLKQCFTEDHKS
ncbi:MAG: Mut7-C RNAse domain-containing protein [Candidatus Desulfofervidaceae bacterium]|nr:Mut7-C RNAse domain-containing protein [Candidatus Desulfofervidaceae bacterium]MDL1971497.1 Mut7-C RNAse domain-containing protein [Candidatus Desulfofervidaceae bacterium]